jgi:UDP-glucose 4-epimerase
VSLRTLVAGGAGFIGSHVVRRLLERGEEVLVFDNFSSGTHDRLPADERLTVVEGDLKDFDATCDAVFGCDGAFHLAANPDIARAVTDPAIDFREGTVLAQNLLEAIRVTGSVRMLVYASGSGVYGDQGAYEVDETFGPLRPISTYGASKLGCEALISSYCHMFGLHAVALRFANVVGPRQTHGVVYDFVRRLLEDPSRLTVLGDGSQSKSYIHVDDVIDAMLRETAREPFDVFNAGTGDYVTVREIAELVVSRMGLADVELAFGDTPRGWKGDVPVVRFASDKLHARGWGRPRSSREALSASIDAILAEARAAR